MASQQEKQTDYKPELWELVLAFVAALETDLVIIRKNNSPEGEDALLFSTETAHTVRTSENGRQSICVTHNDIDETEEAAAEMRDVLILSQIEELLRQEKYSAALEAIPTIFADPDISISRFTARILKYQAEIYLYVAEHESHNKLPAYAAAIDSLMSAFDAAIAFEYHYPDTQLIVVIAQLLMRIGMPIEAKQILTAFFDEEQQPRRKLRR